MTCGEGTHVLILTLVFPPDSVSTAEIMGDLATDLRALGHRVTVLTTEPHYNPTDPSLASQILRPCWGRLLLRSDYGGVPVYHAAMPQKGRNVLSRLLGWVGFHLISTAAGMIMVDRPDVVLAPSPPLTNGVAAWVLGRLKGAPFVYNVQEIYPDIAINLGAVRNRHLIALLKGLERFVYRRAAGITVIAPRMRERLLERRVPEHKVHVIPNFVDLHRLGPMPRANRFAREHGLEHAFVVNYSGNMGPAQGLETALDAAELLQQDAATRLVLIGEGTLRTQIEQRARRLSNVLILPYQPSRRMSEIYGASDLCLVAQAKSTGSDAIPSKAYRIMACERPVLAVTEEHSDLAGLVTTAGAGFVVPPGDPVALADAVRRAASDPERLREMGRQGRAHVEAHYSRARISARYSKLLTLVGRRSGSRHG